MADFEDDIDDLVAALKASGWDKPSSTAAVSEEDQAVVAKLFGTTNARRAGRTPKGRRVRMVRTTEVYAVENSRGWIVGAMEGRQNRVIYQDLDHATCKRFLTLARGRGFNVVEHTNPVRFRQPTPPRAYWWEEATRPTPPPSKLSTPSKHVKPSRVLEMLDKLKGFKA